MRGGGTWPGIVDFVSRAQGCVEGVSRDLGASEACVAAVSFESFIPDDWVRERARESVVIYPRVQDAA